LVTILGANLRKNNRFISVRWKLVSTYLLLVIISLIIINAFISQTILDLYLDQRKIDMLSKANILSNRVKHSLSVNRNSVVDSYIKNTLVSYSKQINSRIIVLDNNSIVREDSNEIFNGQIFRHIEIQRAFQQISNSSIYNLTDYGHVLYTAVPITLYDKIVGETLLSTSLNDIYETDSEINKKLIIISQFSIFFIDIIGFGFAGML